MIEHLDDTPPLRTPRRPLLGALAGSCVSFLWPPLEAQQRRERDLQRPSSFILLWLAGGPSQLETWDPHPGTFYGGDTESIATKISGLQIAAGYPQIAEQIDALSVIRSLVSKEGDHERGTYFVKTGYRPVPALKHPSVGAVLARMRPSQGVEIPQHVSLGSSQWPARGGFLGPQFDAFKVYSPGRGIPNMRARVSGDRRDRRIRNLELLSRDFRHQRQVQAAATQHRETIERALRMMDSEQLRAFEIDDESSTLREAYGDSDFGRGCLVARRLVEQGVRAVEVTLGGFDSHVNNFGVHRERAAVLDPAFATLVRDLRERDLLDSTVVPLYRGVRSYADDQSTRRARSLAQWILLPRWRRWPAVGDRDRRDRSRGQARAAQRSDSCAGPVCDVVTAVGIGPATGDPLADWKAPGVERRGADRAAARNRLRRASRRRPTRDGLQRLGEQLPNGLPLANAKRSSQRVERFGDGINAETRQDGRRQVGGRYGIGYRKCTDAVARSVDVATLDAAARQEGRVAVGPMIAARLVVDLWRAPELP